MSKVPATPVAGTEGRGIWHANSPASPIWAGAPADLACWAKSHRGGYRIWNASHSCRLAAVDQSGMM